MPRDTDFHEAFDKAASTFSPPVRSLMDVDFYKFTMGQLILKRFGDVEVCFELIVRDKDIPLAEFLPEQELGDSLDYARSLEFRHSDLYWLRGIDLYERNMFKEEYLDFLRAFRLPAYDLNYRDGQLKLRFKGPWSQVSHWETIALAIVSELYYRNRMRRLKRHEVHQAYVEAQAKLYKKLEKIAAHPKVRFADFGQRRRHSFLWQQWVIGAAKEMLPNQFVGTSNTWMAFHHNLVPIGTNAHELPMVMAALADTPEDKYSTQYEVLQLWQGMYGQGLRIFLPDTFGTKQFLDGAPSWLASWRGYRQDSGDPIADINLYIKWLEKNGVKPKDRLAIPSDGLDVDEMIRLQKYFDGQINLSFGWGTLLTNDFIDCAPGNMLRPFSVVCKVVEVNGRPAVKLSNNRNKATGPAAEVERYANIFHSENRRQAVLV